jgi:hypothetical protein
MLGSVSGAGATGRGREMRPLFASGGPRVGAALDVQELKRSAKRPDSVWHAVVFVGMSGVLHMPTQTRAWHAFDWQSEHQ